MGFDKIRTLEQIHRNETKARKFFFLRSFETFLNCSFSYLLILLSRQISITLLKLSHKIVQSLAKTISLQRHLINCNAVY